MSSFSISASGSRGYSIGVTEQATSVQTPSKAGDNVSAQFGSCGEMKMVLPSTARLERIKKGKDSYVRLVIPSGSVMVFCESTGNGWPHVFVNAGKHLTDWYADAEVLEVVQEEVGSLIPADEQASA